MNKEEIKKLIDKKIKEKENTLIFYNLFFIAFTIFFGALIQMLIYFYVNSEYVVPRAGKLLIFIGVTSSMFIIYYILNNIIDKLNFKKEKFLHYFLIPLSLVSIIFLLGLFILYQGPKANLAYRISCPNTLENGANISLYVENRGKTIPSFMFFSNSSGRLSFVDLYSGIINESLPSTRSIYPQDKVTLNYPIYLKTYENSTNISIINYFKCPNDIERDCNLITIQGNENECLYVKEKNVYIKRYKIVRIIID